MFESECGIFITRRASNPPPQGRCTVSRVQVAWCNRLVDQIHQINKHGCHVCLWLREHAFWTEKKFPELPNIASWYGIRFMDLGSMVSITSMTDRGWDLSMIVPSFSQGGNLNRVGLRGFWQTLRDQTSIWTVVRRPELDSCSLVLGVWVGCETGSSLKRVDRVPPFFIHHSGAIFVSLWGGH